MRTKSTRHSAQWDAAQGAVVAFAIGFTGCGKVAPPVNSLEMKPAVEANTAFAVDFYKRQKDQPGNLFFSPYSISTALAMTWAGARGKTEQEMATVLRFTAPQSDVHRAFAGLANRVEAIQKSEKVRLNSANSLWCQKDYPFLEDFLKLTRAAYHADANSVDFAMDADGARREINDWVARKTQDKIQNLLQPPLPNPSTVLVLCNAIYFKGAWLTKFDAKSTHDSPFFTARERSVPVPTMTQQVKLRIQTFDDFILLTLPYNRRELSMAILLPKAVDGLAALESKLDAAKLREWLAAVDVAHEAEVQLFLPKFKMTWRLDLKPDLAAMGMPTAFQRGLADFTGMASSTELFIAAVIHQAFVDVNEEGTEAAAATAVIMAERAVAALPQMRIDHPFLFLIRDNRTGSILFLGRVVDPRS